jgi:hypothetical protein
MFESIFETAAFGLWTVFVVYLTWYFTKAKHYAPLTPREAQFLWRIHKDSLNCRARRWREIEFKGMMIGFECECGFKHVQRRPIVAGTTALKINSVSAFRDSNGFQR